MIRYVAVFETCTRPGQVKKGHWAFVSTASAISHTLHPYRRKFIETTLSIVIGSRHL